MPHVIDWRYFPHSRIELLIASSRVVFASFSLLAVWLDPSEPARYAEVAYGLMVGYVIYSLAVVFTTWRIGYPLKKFALITHVFDLAIFTVFMFFTEGSRSPFFAYIIFSVICATLRWHWRGAVYTSIAALVAFIGLGIYAARIVHDPDFDLNTFIVRSGYLAIIALLLSYMGAHQQQMWNEITALAEWPGADIHDIQDLMRKLLLHACNVLGAPRSLAIWEESEEPWLNVAFHSEDGFRMTREAPDAFGEIVPEPLINKNCLCFNTDLPESTVLCDSNDAFEYLHQITPISRELQRRYEMRSMSSMNLQGERLKGRLFILDKPRMTSDDLVMGKIVAMRISVILNQCYLLQELRQTAVAEERIRLARDLHDGMLQSLAGIGLKMQTIDLLIDRDPSLARNGLGDIQKLLASEQRDLRCLIQELKPFGSGVRNMDVSFRVRLDDLVKLIGRHWGLRVELDAAELVRPLPDIIEQEVYFILREALVNSAKHAAASRVTAHLKIEDGKVHILVADNGCGFQFHGRYDHAALSAMQLGPGTIKERVGALGGTLTIDSGSSGACLRVELPLEVKEAGGGDSCSTG